MAGWPGLGTDGLDEERVALGLVAMVKNLGKRRRCDADHVGSATMWDGWPFP
jgi:hypothetical protein